MTPLPPALEAALNALGVPAPREARRPVERPAEAVWRPQHPNDEPPF